jgi:NitT/TauT family transport system permease protein
MATETRATSSIDEAISEELSGELSGLDALEVATRSRQSVASKVWKACWPAALAVIIGVGVWQLVYLSGWKPDYTLASPREVGAELWHAIGTLDLWKALATTMRRAAVGFAAATAVGLVVGLAVARSRTLRAAIGSLITGLQTMPSIAWFPLAILLFQLSETAILFVVVLGAAPSVANGVIAGVDYVPPTLVRVGRNLGARGISMYRHVIAPASLPSIIAGLKQGWAFAWRSLMAGELLVIIAERPSLGARLQLSREFNDSAALIATMVIILVIGIVVDQVFGAVDRGVRRRWGLVEAA